MRDYVRGLLAPVGRTNGWQLAQYAGHRDPAGLQHLLNGARWDADAVRDDLREYVGQQLGSDGVLIIDDTGFIKKGTTSAGVSRPYTGTSGKIDNCQIGVFAAYATGHDRALVDRELYLPKSWTKDRERCREAKIPDERIFATKGELAKGLVRRCIAAGLPAAWVTADEAYGQDWSFRRLLEQLDIGYVVACRSPSRSSPWRASGASTNSSRKHPPTPGRPSPAATEPRARESTTGPRPNCPPTSSSTRTHPPITAG
ncbi:IS701 family transposase [Streptomyces sp900105755]|uniref:IS701 family transposase n=1 Tax=Streptomyces sp. 900105755 TaxID=3154389 RepID=A0ABV1TCJ1_9ACTN